MTYPIPGDPEEFEQRLDADQMNQLVESDRQILEQANKTITNLIRKEPIVYMEVARNALIRSLEKEKIQLDIRNRELLDKLAAARELLRDAPPGLDTLLLVNRLSQILGED